MAFAWQGSLRLQSNAVAAGSNIARAKTVGQAGGGEANYYNKLITLFPAEALTLYGTGVAVFGHSRLAPLLICLAVLILLRWIANKPADGGPSQLLAIGVAVISFLLWTTATDPGYLGDFNPHWSTADVRESAQKWAAYLGAVFVLIAPAFVQPVPAGEPDTQH